MQLRRISKAVPAVDTISRLPDEILCHILSFVTTKEAVATSILSNRWIHLWHYVPNINFTITLGTIQSILSFNEFVDSVLASRDAAGSHFINTFHLKITSHQNRHVIRLGCPSITEWVNLVVQHRLEYLFLHLYIPCIPFDALLPNLPISIFTCTTLVCLDLRWFSVKGFSFSSVGFGFPSLKTLRLNIIKFSQVRDLMLLIAGCPILEDLLLSDIKFRGEEDPLTIQHEFKSLSLPKLTRADITKCWCYFPMKALSNTGYLCIDKFNRKVYEVNQLRCLSNDVPIFHNLTHLKLINNWNLVVQVLHRCPKLQNLELFKRTWNEEEDGQESWVEPEFVPQCLSSYLTTCTIQNIGSLQSELMLATYILKNAGILQTMEIWNVLGRREQPEIERKLSSCPKASAACQLLVF